MSKNINTEIIIIGAGLTGLTLGCSLAKEGFNIVIIDKQDPKIFLAKSYDRRSSAISYGSSLILKNIGLWENVENNAGEILDIRVTDSNSLMHLHYNHKLVGNNPMGYMLENSIMIKQFLDHLESLKNITFLSKSTLKDIMIDKYKATVILDNGTEITSKLVFAADGTNSCVRKKAGIEVYSKNYEQSGIVCTLKHEIHHNHIAQERFLASGPFAILPLKDGYHSSLVWTEKSSLASIFMKMPKKEFMHHLKERFSDYLGELSIVGKCLSYPIELKLARKYASERLILIGNAAHTIHPIAGQGFNLALRDIENITKLISKNNSLGLDIANKSLLNKYESIRKYDVITMAAVTDFLNQLFICQSPYIKLIRRFGLATVNKIPNLKKLLIKHAMGIL